MAGTRPAMTRKRSSSGTQHMDDAACDHGPRLRRISRHMRGLQMRLERSRALPFLDDDEAVRAECGLERADALGIDGRPVFDAALLGMHGRHIGAELLQDGLALAGLRGDDGKDMDHWRSAPLGPR